MVTWWMYTRVSKGRNWERRNGIVRQWKRIERNTKRCCMVLCWERELQQLKQFLSKIMTENVSTLINMWSWISSKFRLQMFAFLENCLYWAAGKIQQLKGAGVCYTTSCHTVAQWALAAAVEKHHWGPLWRENKKSNISFSIAAKTRNRSLNSTERLMADGCCWIPLCLVTIVVL